MRNIKSLFVCLLLQTLGKDDDDDDDEDEEEDEEQEQGKQGQSWLEIPVETSPAIHPCSVSRRTGVGKETSMIS